MALSEHEQRMLDELERHLYQHDADVVSTTEQAAPSLSVRSLVLAVLAAAAGLAVILLGVGLQLPILGVVGFALMVIGVSAAVARRSKNETTDASASESGRNDAGAPDKGQSGPSLMDRLDERWDRRQNPGS